MNYEQRDLFSEDICKNRHRDNVFSVLANPSADQKSRDRIKIIGHIRTFGPRSAEQIERELKIGRSTVSARMSELKRDNVIRRVSVTTTTTGSQAGVYDLT